ncbi:MAG: transcriptional repressor LexA [Thermodesulfovibrionales bacterium]|nr:transcriptional repressor LexA [Thermodesulfovibrionales bacterium]
MNTRPLTDKQSEILEFLKQWIQDKGYPPTIAEIATYFHFHVGAARGHLQALQKKGYIKINPNISRGIEITGLTITQGRAIPVAGKVRAGEPLYCIEEITSQIYIDRELFKSHNPFSLKITGDSMKEAGIFDGDYVIVNPQDTIDNGEIALVLIGDEATVKRVFINEDDIILRAENRDIGDRTYKASEVLILGKVIGVIRKI